MWTEIENYLRSARAIGSTPTFFGPVLRNKTSVFGLSGEFAPPYFQPGTSAVFKEDNRRISRDNAFGSQRRRICVSSIERTSDGVDYFIAVRTTELEKTASACLINLNGSSTTTVVQSNHIDFRWLGWWVEIINLLEPASNRHVWRKR